MSKPVPVYADSPRPSSPASALLAASRCLTASRVAPPVHDVSTTRATTPDPGDQHHSVGQDADPASQDLSLRHLEYEISVWLRTNTCQTHGQCPCVQRPCRIRSRRRRHGGRWALSLWARPASRAVDRRRSPMRGATDGSEAAPIADRALAWLGEAAGDGGGICDGWAGGGRFLAGKRDGR